MRLANEVFLLIKEAYSELSERARHQERPARPPEPPAAVPTPPKAPVEEARARAEQAPAHRPRSTAQTVLEAAQQSVAAEKSGLDEALELCERERWGEARAELHRLAVAHPKNRELRAHLHYAWGREHLQAGRPDQARAELRRALSIDPAFAAARRALDSAGDPQRGLLAKIFGK